MADILFLTKSLPYKIEEWFYGKLIVALDLGNQHF